MSTAKASERTTTQRGMSRTKARKESWSQTKAESRTPRRQAHGTTGAGRTRSGGNRVSARGEEGPWLPTWPWRHFSVSSGAVRADELYGRRVNQLETETRRGACLGQRRVLQLHSS